MKNITPFLFLFLTFTVPSSFAENISNCGLSQLDLTTYPLEPQVTQLIQESCSKKPNKGFLKLQETLKELKPQEVQNFLNHLSNSHPKAQKRFFEYLTSMSPLLLKIVILQISQINPCENG